MRVRWLFRVVFKYVLVSFLIGLDVLMLFIYMFGFLLINCW